MPDLNRSGLLLALITVLTVAVAYQAYELDSIRSDLREATTVLRAMSGGQSFPLARTGPADSNAKPRGVEKTAGKSGQPPADPAVRGAEKTRVESSVRKGQLPPTVDKTYTPKKERVVDLSNPCKSGCRAAMQCALHNQRCPGVTTKTEAVFYPLCMAACRRDAPLRAQLVGPTPCNEGLSGLRSQVPKLDAACMHGR